MPKRKTHYAFLDAVMDVLYSVVLYNLFVNFPGFENLATLVLFFFVTVLMINYWWFSRSIAVMPRYFLVDVYFYATVMFIFMRLTGAMADTTAFLGWLTVLFAVDLVYSIVDLMVVRHAKSWLVYLNHFMAWNFAIMLIYFAAYLFIKELTPLLAFALVLPYAAYMAYSFAKGLMKVKLEYRD
jgi:hypothetical protein